MNGRGVSTSLSSCSTSGSEASAYQASGVSDNGMTMLRDLYEEMEPQITKSYRPHVVYVPPSKPVTAQQRLRALLDKRKSKFKATNIMMQAVKEMKRKTEVAAAAKNKESDKEKPGKSLEATPKNVSQSLPNLSNTS